MTRKPIRARPQALRDIDDAFAYYAEEAGQRVAHGFTEALKGAYRSIVSNPGMGSPRYQHELKLAGLRSFGLKQYPYLIFYIERDDHTEIWRVLHAQRDIPSSIQDLNG